MTKFSDFTDAVLSDAKELAQDLFDGFEDQAVDIAKGFLEKTKEDVERWGRLVVEQKLTQQDFSDLVAAKKALAEMQALTISGIALAKAERFRSQLIASVVDRAFGILI
jgi:hypothetical protein